MSDLLLPQAILPNFFDNLPQRLLLHIFNWLTLEELRPVLSCCRRFHKQRENQLLCQKLCLTKWKSLQLNHPPLLPADRNWTWLVNCLMNFVDEEKLQELQTQINLHFRSRDHLYIGEFDGGKKNGKGMEISSTSGIIYIGEFKNEKKEGKGIRTDPSGDFYDGEWKNDLKNGSGIQCFKGGRYEGEWKDGLRHGRGAFYWVSGSKYEGHWENDLKHGYGIYKWNSGDKYKGLWKKGKYDFGCYRSDFGSLYFGSHNFEGKYDGFGTFIHPDGYSWYGAWTNGVPTDPEASVHPRLRKVIQDKCCTKVLTKDAPFYGQFIYKCKCMDENVCKTCAETCHSGHVFSEVFWTVGRTTCQCHCCSKV